MNADNPVDPGRPVVTPERARWMMSILLIAFTLYAAAFIMRTSFEVNGVRYFCLFDDAMISMRYAKNLAAGAGLVWNPGGERVEGFTNPLWTGFMALFHLLPIAAAKVSLGVQVSGGLCLLGTLVFLRKIAAHLLPGSTFGQFAPVFLAAFYVPLLNWSLQGMEVGLLALIVTVAFWKAVRPPDAGTIPWSLYLLLAAGTFVRIDFTPVAIVLLGALVCRDRGNQRAHLLFGAAILGLGLVIQTALRFAYFGELLPNTYYLKMTGVPVLQRLLRGGRSFLDFASGMTWVLFLFPFTVLFLRRHRAAVLAAVLFLVQCAYSISVGGDAWEWWGGSNRYIAIVMPCFFLLFGLALAEWQALWAKRVRTHRPLVRGGGIAVVCVFLVLSYFGMNNVRGVAGIREWLEGGSYLVTQGTRNPPGAQSPDIEGLVQWLIVPVPLELDENIRMVHAAMLMDSLTSPEARVAVTLAGALPYFADRTYIDLLGKNDRQVARMPARATIDPRGAVSYTPGHSKWSYAYSIGALKPDLVFQLWAHGEEARPFLDAEYRAEEVGGQFMFFRRDARSIRWDAVARLRSNAHSSTL